MTRVEPSQDTLTESSSPQAVPDIPLKNERSEDEEPIIKKEDLLQTETVLQQDDFPITEIEIKRKPMDGKQEEETLTLKGNSLDDILRKIDLDDAAPEEKEQLTRIIHAIRAQQLQQQQQEQQEQAGEKQRGINIPDTVALPVLAACFVLLFAIVMGKVWYQMNQVKKLHGNK